MSHGHHHHGHVSPETDRRRLWLAFWLIAGFMCVEVVVGILASSLALLSDAAHMLTDAGAIALSLLALRLARRPAGGALTYGLKRVEILSAQANGLTLAALGVVIVVEAVRRLVSPPEVEGIGAVVTGSLGLVVNLLALWALSGAERRSLNVQGSVKHVAADLYASLAAVAAGAVVLATGFHRADPIASLVVAGLMGRSAWGLIRDSGRVLMEAAPAGVDPDEIGRAMAATPGVREVHDLHVWEVTSGFPTLSAHVLVGADEDCHATRRELERMLGERFSIDHTTLQVDHEPRPGPFAVAPAPRSPSEGPPAA